MNRLFRFLISGMVAALTDLGLLYLLTEVAGIWYLISAVIAFLVAVVVSFTLQKLWTFKDYNFNHQILRRQISLFIVLVIANLFLNTVSMYFLVERFNLPYLFSQVLVGGLIAVSNFLIYHKIFMTVVSLRKPHNTDHDKLV